MGKCVRVEPKEGGSEKDLTENAIILKEHQERVRERLQKQDGLILDHGLGSGKTISAIAAAEDFGGAVVVTPASLRENFKKELRRYQAKGQYDVMSYEEFVRDRPNLVGRMLIVDEAHRLANSSTKRTQAIAEEASKASKRLLLTATPLQNRPSDASTLVNIAAGEKILPVGEADFRRKYLYRVGYVEGAFDNIFRGVPTYGSLKPKNLDEYRRKVSRYVDFYAPNQEGFPTVAKHTVNIPMSKAQARAQEAWLKEMPPDMKQRIKDGRPPESGDISRLNTFMNATRQTANTGGAYGATDEDLSPKVAAIADRIADSKGKALVYSNYIDSGVAPLEKALKQKGISSVRLTGGMSDRDRAQIVRDYNNDKFRTLIISSAGGEGLDLKKTEQIHVMEPHWNDEKINQVIGRGVRYKSHEGLPPDRQHVDVYKYVSVFPDEYFLFWNRYKGLKTADEYLSLMSERKLQLNQAFLNSYRRRSDAKQKAKCDRKAGWTQGQGKCVRVKPAQEKPAPSMNPAGVSIKVASVAAGLAGLSVAGYFAARERYRSQIPSSAEEALKRSFEIDPDTLPDFKGKEGILLAQPGFGGFLGKTQARGVEKIMERGFKDMAGDRYGTFMLPNEKFNVYMPDYVPEGWNPEDMRTYKMGPGGEAAVILPASRKMIKTALTEGKNQQSIEATAYLLAMERKFREQNPDRDPVIKAAGYSAGGMILSESNMQLKHLGKKVEMLFLGSPYYGLTDETPNITRVGSRNDPAMKFVPHGKVKYFDEVKFHAHYQDYPGVRSFISDWLKKGTSGERTDSLYRGDRRPPAKCDPKRGWERGTNGKCVRSQPAPLVRAKTKSSSKNTQLIGGAAAVTAIVGAAALQVMRDIKNVAPEKPDPLMDYDSFVPGDLIRKRGGVDGNIHHYAIYAGKDPETGEHQVIHTALPRDWDNHQSSISVVQKTSIWEDRVPEEEVLAMIKGGKGDAPPEIYSKVPDSEIYQKKNSRKMTREEILRRAESAVGTDVTFHALSSNCEVFARGIVEDNPYSSQKEKVSPLTAFLGDTLTRIVAVTQKKEYLFNKNRRTAQQIIDEINRREKGGSHGRKDSVSSPNVNLRLLAVLKVSPESSPPLNLLDSFCDQIGIKRPEDYSRIAERIARDFRSLTDEIKIEMYANYLKVLLGTLKSQDILDKDRADSVRLDRRPPAKCDPRYGWKQGVGGKCVRVRKPDIATPRKGEALAASLGSYEINPDTGRPYKIRELRGIAREKGLVGYGSMTTGQMKSAMRLIDESPEDAQRKNLIKTLSRDRSISSKAIAAGLGNVKGNSPAGRRLIKEVKEANLTFKRFAALMKFASTSPAGWGVLGAAAFLGERTIAQWGKVKDDYRNGLDESAKIAASRVPNVNVRHPTPTNPKGQFFRPSASRATGKKTGSENITFVVSGAASGASRMIEDLRQLGKAPKATEAEKWMSRNNFVPIDLKETRVASADGGLDEAVQMMGDFMQNRKRGRNQDAVDLASSLFAHATAYPDKRVNLIAHGAGGLATKEALEILSRMEVKKGNRVIKGKDLVGKFNVVLLGTPHFGYTETVAQNTRTVTSPNDPFSRIPFSGGGMRPQWISSVKGHKPSDYLSDASVREAIRESFGYYRTDSASLEP